MKSSSHGWALLAASVPAVLLGLLYAWASRFEMASDGIAYLDLGAAWWRGDWRNAVNSLWSPLYSVVVGGVVATVKPSPFWEFPIVHYTNLVIYLLAFGCFWSFLVTFLAWQKREYESHPEPGYACLPFSALLAIGYCLFLISSIKLIGVDSITPDMLVAADFYAAMALMLRIILNPLRWRLYPLLGLVLGLGYLTKTPLLPISILILIMLFRCSVPVRKMLPRVALAGAVLVIVASPYVLMLSRVKGGFTLGDSAALNYAWHVTGLPRFHWQGEIDGSGVAAHPTRKLHDDPSVYEFGEPIQGTYPIWYDASYWNQGIKPHVKLARQLKVITSGLSVYFYIFVHIIGGVVAGFLTLCLIAGRRVLNDAGRAWPILLPAIAGFLMYVPVHAELRYLGAFTVVLCLGLLGSIRVPGSYSDVARKICLSAVVFSAAGLGGWAARSAYDATTASRDHKNGAIHKHWLVASAMAQVGVQAGEKIAVIDKSNYSWAHLAHVKIAAEIPSASGFWALNPAQKEVILSELRKTGVQWVVASSTPDGVPPTWQRLGKTRYFLYELSKKDFIADSHRVAGPSPRDSPSAQLN